MTTHIVEDGCSKLPKTVPVRFLGITVGGVTYCVGLAAAATLLSLIAVVLSGPFIGQGEKFELVGLKWLYALPFVYLLCAGSVVLYPRYRESKTWLAATVLFFANACGVALFGMLVGWVFPLQSLSW